MITLIIGLFVGAFIGFIFAAILVSSSNAEESLHNLR